LKNRLTQEEVEVIVKEAVEIEKEFILESIPCNMIGMNRELMSKYIEFVADRLVKQLGYQPIWKSTNPFDFMELISMETKTNFFEKKVSEYSMAKVDTGVKNNNIEFNVDF
jgi:ribonucleotide reductase beta subunit family protein with ferritin-like domain